MRSDAQLVREAVELPELPFDTIANAAGRTPSTIWRYRSGRVRMPKSVRMRVAEFYELRARQLQQIAEALRTSAGRPEAPRG